MIFKNEMKWKLKAAVLHNGFVELFIWNILVCFIGLVYTTLFKLYSLSKLGRDVIFWFNVLYCVCWPLCRVAFSYCLSVNNPRYMISSRLSVLQLWRVNSLSRLENITKVLLLKWNRGLNIHNGRLYIHPSWLTTRITHQVARSFKSFLINIFHKLPMFFLYFLSYLC